MATTNARDFYYWWNKEFTDIKSRYLTDWEDLTKQEQEQWQENAEAFEMENKAYTPTPVHTLTLFQAEVLTRIGLASRDLHRSFQSLKEYVQFTAEDLSKNLNIATPPAELFMQLNGARETLITLDAMAYTAFSEIPDLRIKGWISQARSHGKETFAYIYRAGDELK